MRVYVVRNSAKWPEDWRNYGYFSTRKRANVLAKALQASESISGFDKPIKVTSIQLDTVKPSHWTT